MIPGGHEVTRVHPQTLGMPGLPPPQVCPCGQDPLLHWPPHPFDAPQPLPTQLGVQPHMLGVPPPPQVCPVGHDPPLHLPPQPSAAPQVFPVQFGAPQSTVRLQLSSTIPHLPMQVTDLGLLMQPQAS